jgi:hypothetical protein
LASGDKKQIADLHILELRNNSSSFKVAPANQERRYLGDARGRLFVRILLIVIVE